MQDRERRLTDPGTSNNTLRTRLCTGPLFTIYNVAEYIFYVVIGRKIGVIGSRS